MKTLTTSIAESPRDAKSGLSRRFPSWVVVQVDFVKGLLFQYALSIPLFTKITKRNKTSTRRHHLSRITRLKLPALGGRTEFLKRGDNAPMLLLHSVISTDYEGGTIAQYLIER